jgi:hypothetical protein
MLGARVPGDNPAIGVEQGEREVIARIVRGEKRNRGMIDDSPKKGFKRLRTVFQEPGRWFRL